MIKPAEADPANSNSVISSLRIGGRIVMDDITAQRMLSSDSSLWANDLKRQFFSSEPRLVFTEVVLPDVET